MGVLRWVAEIFFPWGNRPCHQICLYYDVTLADDRTPRAGVFPAVERVEGRRFTLLFHWVPLAALGDIPLYPENAKALLTNPRRGVEHFVYRE